jgi:prepilin-type N-terminal cleavage/methylation domain-containing protein
MKTLRGFSLVEVLIAVGVLAGVLTGVGAAVTHGAQTIALARETTVATSAARAILEDLLTPRLADLPGFVVSPAPDPDATRVMGDTRDGSSVAAGRWGVLARSGLHGGYAVVTLEPLHVTGPATIAEASALRVRVDVGWLRLGRERVVSFQTVRF